MRPPTLVAARFDSQLLGNERAADTTAVARRLLAVQAQDLRSARLAIRARTTGLTVADLDRALTVDRTVVVGWLNRGTLQLVRLEDFWWLHALTTPPLVTAVMRRLEQTGVGAREATRAVAAIERALTEEGPLAREQLRDRVQRTHVETAGQALIHLLFLACLQGVAVRGPMQGKQHAYVLARDWVGRRPEVDRGRALAELARRYLAAHAPADDRDLAKWAGLPLRDARAGLEAIAAELVVGDDGLLSLGPRPTAGVPRTCLLDQWDPVLVRWRSRTPLLAAYAEAGSGSGMSEYRPFAYVAGRAVATWSLRGGAVTLEPFAAIGKRDSARLAADAADLERFLR